MTTSTRTSKSESAESGLRFAAEKFAAGAKVWATIQKATSGPDAFASGVMGSGMTIDLRWSKVGGSETVCNRDAHLAGSLLGLENRKRWGHCLSLHRIIGASWRTRGGRVRTYALAEQGGNRPSSLLLS